MGYLKMTLSSGDVKTILADGILSIEDGSAAAEIEVTYNGANGELTKVIIITATSASDRDDLKVAVRNALVEYQANQQGPAIEANGGYSVSNVSV